jgi:hypothetical protein
VPPYALLTLGKTVAAIDRKDADREALKFAIALHKDQVLGPKVKYAGTYPLRRADDYKACWRTGKKSFAAWITTLEDTVNLGESFWHQNSKSFLVNNRTTAVRYLQDMQKRYSAETSAHLSAAIEQYNAVIAEARKIDTHDGPFKSVQGRKNMIGSIKAIDALEDKAVAELEIALKTMGPAK